MDIAQELAKTYVYAQASMTKEALEQDPALLDTREKFEKSVTNETVARRHAARLADLARSRSEEEDTSLGGYAGTLAKRLAPIPQTVGEAAWRLPAVGAGAAAGYVGGKHLEALDKLKLRQAAVLDPDAAQRAIANPKAIQELAARRLKAQSPGGRAAPAAQERLSKAIEGLSLLENPSDIASVLHETPEVIGLTPRQKAVRDELRSALGGEEGMSFLRGHVQNLVSKGKRPPGPLAELVPEFHPYRVGGALAGGAAAGALTGIPLAMRALYLKRSGGEAAARARSAMSRAMAEAEAESGKRERLLGALPKAAALSINVKNPSKFYSLVQKLHRNPNWKPPVITSSKPPVSGVTAGSRPAQTKVADALNCAMTAMKMKPGLAGKLGRPKAGGQAKKAESLAPMGKSPGILGAAIEQEQQRNESPQLKRMRLLQRMLEPRVLS